MHEDVLFHAYVVSGARANARAHIASLLTSFQIPQTDSADYAVTEQVNFTIDDARTLKAWQSLSPEGERKVHVVYADFITNEAQNALLKLLEEPTPNTHIIFAIPQPDILLPTLLSRVRVVHAKNTQSGKQKPTVFENVSIDAFVSMNYGERIALISKVIEKSDSDEASAEVREKAVACIEAIEIFLAQNVAKNSTKLAQLLALKKYLYFSGASVKMILETVALTL